MVAHEAPTFGGIGGEIAARISERAFHSLEAPVIRVGGFHMPYPVAKVEEDYLPDIDRILEALDRALSYWRPPHLPACRRLLAEAPLPNEDNMTLNKFNLPDVGEGLTEAEIVAWKVKPGDTVAINDVLCEIETAKSLVELPSPFAGTVTELLVPEGITIDVGTADHQRLRRAPPATPPPRTSRLLPSGAAAVRKAAADRPTPALRTGPGRRSAGGLRSQGRRRQAPCAQNRTCRAGRCQPRFRWLGQFESVRRTTLISPEAVAQQAPACRTARRPAHPGRHHQRPG